MMIYVLRLITVRSLQTGLILVLASILLISAKTGADVTMDAAKPAAGEDNAGAVASGLSLLAPDAANSGWAISPSETAAQSGAGWDFTRNDARTGGLYNMAASLIAGAGEAAMPPPDALACIATMDLYLYAVQSAHIVDTLLAFQNFVTNPSVGSPVSVIPVAYTPGVNDPFSAVSSAQSYPDLAAQAAYEVWMADKSRQSARSAWFDAECSV